MTTKDELIDGYDDALAQFQVDMDEYEKKCEAIKILSDAVEQIRDDVPRNTLLEMRQKINDLKSQSAKCDKLIKGSITWADNAILLRLQSEELDNYTRGGKMFYPSTQTYVSVADRVALDHFVNESNSLEIFGNSLNKDFVLGVIESTGEAPPGVTTFRKTRLNVRSK